MKLPIPFVHNGKTYTDVDVKKPNTDAIAECKDKVRDGSLYAGMQSFAAGSIASISGDSTLEEKAEVKKALADMPYRDIETILLQAVIKTGVDDVIEGIYPCPRCKVDLIPPEADPEYNPDDPEHNWDDADRISKLKTVSTDKVARTFTIELETAVETKDADSGETMDSVDALELRDATLDDMIRAERKVGTNSEERFNAALHAEVTVKVGGKPVDRKWKGEWGTWLYERIDFADTKKIQAELRRFGTMTVVDRVCKHCGKKWEAAVDTGSFFASGLGG